MIREPFKLSPAFKDYLWGGEQLRTVFGKQTDMTPLAESWELSVHKDGPSVVATGDFAGKTLAEVLQADPEALGTDCPPGGLPILIKLIDAKQQLSVQVHPTEDYAMRVEHEHGKTEMWYVIAAQPGAELLYGMNRTLTKEEFTAHIEDGTLLQDINAVKVKPGDVLFIEAGTLHGIGAGCLVAEIQQNSNSTYRVFDYHRKDKDGNLRELHIDKALAVTRLEPPARPAGPLGPEIDRGGYTETVLGVCDYFSTTLLKIKTSVALCADCRSYHALLLTRGEADVKCPHTTLHAKAGECVFLPACTSAYRIAGDCDVLVTTL